MEELGFSRQGRIGDKVGSFLAGGPWAMTNGPGTWAWVPGYSGFWVRSRPLAAWEDSGGHFGVGAAECAFAPCFPGVRAAAGERGFRCFPSENRF